MRIRFEAEWEVEDRIQLEDSLESFEIAVDDLRELGKYEVTTKTFIDGREKTPN